MHSPWVGFVEVDSYRAESGESPTAVNLATGALRSFRGFDVQDFAMTATGRFAWIEDHRVGTSVLPRTVEVRRDQPEAGREWAGQIVDSGGDIDVNSLAAARTRIYWTRNSEPRSADFG